MATTKDDIKRWLECAQDIGATHVIVKCDTFDYTDYPIDVMPGQDPHKVSEEKQGMLMEVYSLTGKYTIESQLNESRAFHYD